jgi:serine-type D-Ala-D-Ala carboxypeptidase
MRKWIARGLEEGRFPGTVVSVCKNGEPMFFEAHGLAEKQPGERAMELDTRFDLGSLTGVVAILPAVLRSVQMGKLSLIDPVARYLPEFATGIDRFSKGQITVFQLLSHTAGLPAARPLFLSARGVKAYLRALADTPLEVPPGQRMIPSDLGYMLLGFALERIWERPLPEVCERLVFGPLDLTQTSFAGEGLPAELCAATEVGEEQERRASNASGEREHFPWRGGTICGEVRDANAFHGLDGIAGHAGVFSTAGDLNRYLEMWARKGVHRRERYLDITLVSLATSNHTKDLAGYAGGPARGFGWEIAEPHCSVGDGAPAMSYGLSDKQAGVSIWVDPVTKVTGAVLTNSPHPSVREGLGDWLRGMYKRIF